MRLSNGAILRLSVHACVNSFGNGKCTLRLKISPILTTFIVNIFKIKGVNMARDISQQCKKDINAQIDSASFDQKDAEWGDEDLYRISSYN